MGDLRLRRCKAVIINLAFHSALQGLLTKFLREDDYAEFVEDSVDRLAEKWFTDEKVKNIVSQLLARFQLDEFAIEAEALRKSSGDLQQLDRMLASLELRATRHSRHRQVSRNLGAATAGEHRSHPCRQAASPARRCIGQKSIGGLTVTSERQVAQIDATLARARAPDPGLADNERATMPTGTVSAKASL